MQKQKNEKLTLKNKKLNLPFADFFYFICFFQLNLQLVFLHFSRVYIHILYLYLASNHFALFI